MTTVYQAPTSVHITSSSDFDTASARSSTNKQLYKTITPRKKIDKFGLDQTDYKSYLLSSTVFPTGVKATLLGEMQDSDPNVCGFDIVERPKTGSQSHISKATTVIHAPPPTAEHSYRGSQISAPIVAFVNKSHSIISGDRRTSINSKDMANEKSHNDVIARNAHDGSETGLTSHDRVANKESISENDTANENSGHPSRDHHGSLLIGTDIDDSTLDKIVQDKIQKFQERMKNEKKSKSLKSSTISSKAVPRVLAYTSTDAMRNINYHWQSRESRLAEERKDGGDIRDPLYLNTFFPEERPVRYHKKSLPSIPRKSRTRPWTVSEAEISARAAAMTLAQKSHPQRASHTAVAKSREQSLKAAQSLAALLSGKSSANVKDSRHARGEEEEKDDSPPLLEIRPFLANSAVEDQREKLKGKDGCLNSRVKQCVRFVRYREKLDRQDDDRPMKAEGGRYRPFSKTAVTDHAIVNPPPSPEAKLQKSVEIYQKYVDNIALTTKLSSPKPFTFRGSNSSSRQYTATSSAIDTDSLVVQSVMDSNLPDTSGTPSMNSNSSPRPKNSAIYTKDVSGMSQALDIKRLSPKISTSRVVAGTRGAVTREPSPRCPSASTDEGVDMTETTPTNAIMVPVAAKSECASEYSINKDE